MPREVGKERALELLEEQRRRLLGEAKGCLLCALVERARDAPERIFENDAGVVLLDRFAARAGHAIVLARRHVEGTTELGWPLYAELQRLAFGACSAIERALGPLRTFIAVLGASAPLPMTFPHFHIHVVPVYDAGAGGRPARVFSWTEGVLVYDDDEAGALAAQLRAVWAEP